MDGGKYQIHDEGLTQGQNIGENNQITQNFYGPRSIPTRPVPPEQVWLVPYRRNPFFTGRKALLEGLHDRFMTQRTAILSQGQAISGLGGIGKTQIAVEYAYRHRQEYRWVLWVSAATRETIIADFVTIAERLQLPERSAAEQDKIITAVTSWLATHDGWLLIIDNADDLETAWPFFPTGGTGHLLLTTREQAVGDFESFPVEQMDYTEGTLLLLRRAKLLTPAASLEQATLLDRQIAEQIVKEMDGLPLALDQAGAYIEETRCSISDYLKRYRSRRIALLHRRGRSSKDHPASVATTWSLSFQQIEQKNSAAADLLRLCAFLHPDAIPEEIITAGAAHLGPLLQSLAADPLLLDEAISILGAYSLLRRDTREQTLSVHRLVQVVLKDGMDEQSQHQWIELTVRVIDEVCPAVEFTTWQQWERYLPHAQACADLIEQRHLIFSEAALLLHRAGRYLRERARYGEAELLLQQALSIREQHLSAEHSDTSNTLDQLAGLYKDQGKYEQAERLYERALAIDEKHLGAEHSNTAASLNNLASLYKNQGKYEQAEPLYERALSIYEKHLGSEHPSTATSLNNLASLYDNQGKYEQAEPLYERALSIREKHLGAEHPDTANSLNNLALLYDNQGKYEQAEPLYERALSIREKHLGAEHPSTATSLNNLASLYDNQGKYEQAEPLYERALSIREKHLGAEHPSTATSLNNLASLYKNQGKYEQAEPLLQRALSIYEKYLGSEHPSTATSLYWLAFLYQHQKKYEQAEPLYKRALSIYQQKLGETHPDTRSLRENYASLLRAMGHEAEAKQVEARMPDLLPPS